MTKGNIYMLVWLPASGKSSYIEKIENTDAIVLSSDAIRQELTWDASMQHKNSEVFLTLFERLSKHQANKVPDIYIDATSVSIADRRKAINAIKRQNKAKLVSRVGDEVQLESFYSVTAIVFNQHLDVLIQRDKNRERTVWEKVIMRMLARFVPPSLEEWFDNIISIPMDDYKPTRTGKFLEKLTWFCSWNETIDSVLEVDNYLSKSLDCEQTSQWHQETLLEHLHMILDLVQEQAEEKDLKMLRLITLFHDIGKPFVRSTKKDNLLIRGYEHLWGTSFKKKNGTLIDVANYKDYQFLEHENFGANIFVSNYQKILIDNNIITEKQAKIIEVIVRWHLIFHTNEGKTSIIISWVKYDQDTEIFRLGTLFSYCDGNGRIGINDIKNT